MGMGLPVEGEGWWRTLMGAEGLPQGVVGETLATWVKSARDWRPVPPMTAIWMGSARMGERTAVKWTELSYHCSDLLYLPSSCGQYGQCVEVFGCTMPLRNEACEGRESKVRSDCPTTARDFGWRA